MKQIQVTVTRRYTPDPKDYGQPKDNPDYEAMIEIDADWSSWDELLGETEDCEVEFSVVEADDEDDE